MDHTTERFVYCQEHTLKFKKCWCPQYSWIKPRENKGCIFDHFLIYVHLTYLMSSQKETLTSALLGFLKDCSTERPVELFLVKLNKKSFRTQTTLENATYYIFFLEIHTSTLKSLTSPTIKKPVSYYISQCFPKLVDHRKKAFLWNKDDYSVRLVFSGTLFGKGWSRTTDSFYRWQNWVLEVHCPHWRLCSSILAELDMGLKLLNS